jgi:hypothetical protein
MLTKRLLVFTTATLLYVNLPAQTSNLSRQQKNRYEVKSILIRYLISGDASGDVVLRFTDYGRLERKDEDYKYSLYSIEEEKNITTLRRNDSIYTINRNTGSLKLAIDELTQKLLNYKTPYETITSFWINDGGEIIEKDTILGLPVTHWKFTSGTTTELWEWNGIPIKYEKKLGPINYQVSADEIDTAATLSPTVFLLPDSTQVR